MKKYAGIGPRDLPLIWRDRFRLIGEDAANAGWMLRSGAALGADAAFEFGCDRANGQKQIFLPWPGFNGHKSLFKEPPKAAYLLIDELFPDAPCRSKGVRALFARNCQQILGPNLDDWSHLVICWTKNGQDIGGTGRAIKVAKHFDIPVVNLFQDTYYSDLFD